MTGHRSDCIAVAITLAALSSTAFASQETPTSLWSWQTSNSRLDLGLDTNLFYYSMSGTWWNLSAGSTPSFDKKRSFGELWVHPKLVARTKLGANAELYGALSVGATRTLGADAFDYRDQGTVRVGSAVMGLQSEHNGLKYELSLGRQPYTLGTGMLLTAGSSNGFSWGAGASTPRKVWGRTVLGKAGSGEFTGTAFAIEPDEAPEAKTQTRVQGLALEWVRPKTGKAGLSWFTAPRSNAIYPGDLAPLAFIENGRKDLDTWYGWADITGLVPSIPTLGLRAEFAQQRNTLTRANGRRDPLRAEAWLLGLSWWGQTLPFAPKFSYHVARFSGDKPGTQTYERFDPMYWGNGLDNWWFGANGAYSWLNSNLRVRRFILDAYLSQQDIVQLQFVQASADQLNSAVQFGQGVRFTSTGLLVGVPTKKLSNELYLQYVHVFTPKVALTTFFARNTPGAGLKAVAPQGTDTWTTLGMGLTATY